MKKRVAAAVLWLFAGWYAGAFIAWMLGISSVFGPVLGIAAAALIAGDPLQVIWLSAEVAKSRRKTLARLPSPVVATAE
ncbi:MAG TPA: hypothetical protein VEY67_07445 [Candidatus Dormibacteraeota bacterium]|nr:hypothetical protein [Candidatus Dormibacteraeota bacterium]